SPMRKRIMARTPSVGTNPVIVVRKGDGPGVLVNRDILNSVFIGPDTSISQGNLNSASTLDALVGVPVDGKEDIYACTDIGIPAVSLDFIKHAKSWNPSPLQQAQQLIAAGLAKDTTLQAQTSGGTIANEISTAGVPLLTKAVNIVNDANHNIPLSSTVTIA